ncbi:MAG: efflux RND transporter periplasmic adaptor subunit [Deltaproteobacteria bacterium]
MKKTLGIAIISVLTAVAGIIVYLYISPAKTPPYEIAVVRRGSLIRQVSATGIVDSALSVQVGSRASGTVKEIFVDYNSPVKKGEILALIDPEAFYAELSQAEAGLEVANANLARQEASLLYSKALLEKAQAQLRNERLKIKRTETLFDDGFASDSQYDEAIASYETAVAEQKARASGYQAEREAVNAGKAQIAQIEGAVRLAKANLGHTEIRSPMDGIVVSRNVELGQTVAASLQSPTLFVVAQDLSTMEITANVSEADIGEILINQEVTFKVDAYPEHVFGGKVKEIRIEPNIEHKTVSYSVIAVVDNKDFKLRPGMTADVWIKTGYRENVLLIPTIALKQEAGKRQVEVLEGNEAGVRAVQTGIKGAEGYIEVLSGLNEGESVVLSKKR